ncbi:STAS domain-containing protein [Thermospira aquatica]|uniref:STAS domain-containing protein n=1 Tax=Thermospira aquatica TaxID=2828656 RepID=A0AAX3BBL2_9SPIR|nr:STAS domain-containing protein [Thermospira aquatica]URA09608.1 STAS domain-containing protein [Thermospira aquatica]
MLEQFFEKDGVVVVRLKGHLSAENLSPAVKFVEKKLSEGRFLFIFDLSEVSWMGSMALGLLASVIREALVHNTRVRLVGPSPQIISLLEDTSLLPLCHVYATLDEAFLSFR